MTQPLAGIRVLEVDNWGFAPSAGVVLADWGADVVRVEPPGRGDPLRAIFGALNFAPGAAFNFMYEQWNRSKRSIALDLAQADGRAVLDELIGASDVFITNYLPDLRAKLRLTPDEVRTANPNIVYALATGQGSKGPDAGKPSYGTEIIWGPVQSPSEFVDDAQVVANGYIVDAPRPGTDTVTRVMSSPAQFDEQPITARWAAPDIGQHTDEVLEQLGWDAERIAAARSAGFVA